MNISNKFHHKPLFNTIKSFYFTFCLICFTGTSLLKAQDKSANNDFKSFTGQVGVFYDFGIETHWGKTFDTRTISGNKLGIGAIKYKNGRVYQINMDVSYYIKEFDDVHSGISNPGLRKSKFQIEWEYFKSFKNQEQFANRFHFGPVISSAVVYEDYEPFQTNEFNESFSALFLGAGIKTLYAIPIGNESHFFISTELNTFDLSIEFTNTINPNIPIEERQSISILNFQVLRPRMGLDFGFMF